jgi:hypothetical protein
MLYPLFHIIVLLQISALLKWTFDAEMMLFISMLRSSIIFIYAASAPGQNFDAAISAATALLE